MKFILLFLILSFSFCSCKKQKESDNIDSDLGSKSAKTIPVELSDTAFIHVDNILHATSYIRLSNVEPLGEIKRALIVNDLLFVLDNTPKIVCFNISDGSICYKIDNRGGGPKEYRNLLDFTINEDLNCLIAYDSGKRRMVMYDLYTGSYKSSIATDNIAPLQIAYCNNGYFFDNPDHYNYPNQKDLHYSLLHSVNGREIGKHFFAHDKVSDYGFNYGDGHPFFYNDSKILYNRRFDSKIYELCSGGIRPLYKIVLPDSLPLSLIEKHIHPVELSKSDYSWGISRVFECNDLLHFWFSKSGKYYTVFYDLKRELMIYAGNKITNQPAKDLFVYYPIEGVYKNQFFSLVDPLFIMAKKGQDILSCPTGLLGVTETDNPVLVFYKRAY